MSLITIIIVTVVLGVVLYLIQAYIPMNAVLKKWLIIVCVVIWFLWMLKALGILDYLGDVKI